MKKKLKLIILTAVIAVTAACTGLQSSKEPALPSDFIGTWERVGQPSANSLTFTSTTIKASNQNYDWNLLSVSDDVYTIYPTPDPNLKGTISVKRVGDYLEIIDAYDMPNAGAWSGGEDDWTGRWRRR